MQLAAFHPVLTHFPIALLTASFLFQAVVLFRPKWMAATVPLWILGLSVAITLFTALSGEAAAEIAVKNAGVSQEIADLIASHELYANITIWGSIVLFGGWSWFRLKYSDSRLLGFIVLICLFLLMTAVLITGDLGGDLVLDYGVGVKIP